MRRCFISKSKGLFYYSLVISSKVLLLLAAALDVPFAFYEDGKPLFAVPGFEPFFREAGKNARNEDIRWLDGAVLFAARQDKEKLLVFGPARTAEGPLSLFAPLLRPYARSKEESEAMAEGLLRLRRVSLSSFRSSLRAVMALFEMNGGSDDRAAQPSVPEEGLPYEEEQAWAKANMAFVEKMARTIREGDVEGTRAFFKEEVPSPYGELSRDELRHFKNSMMVHIYIVRTAAREGGLDEATSIRMAESYSERCEEAKSIAELTAISQELRLDYARHVRDVRNRRTGDYLVDRAMAYADAHLGTKVDGPSLAKTLGVSAPYLLARFRKKSGKGLSAYLAERRIEEAKRLLRGSGESLIAIASSLGFSSQSYFQRVFKEATGTTPLAYRKAKAGS